MLLSDIWCQVLPKIYSQMRDFFTGPTNDAFQNIILESTWYWFGPHQAIVYYY